MITIRVIMKKTPGRPQKTSEKTKGELLQVRLETSEKQVFAQAAGLSGLELSAWVRERLRRAAIKELGENGILAEFLKNQVEE